MFPPPSEVTLTSVRKRGVVSRDPQTVSQGLFEDSEGSLSGGSIVLGGSPWHVWFLSPSPFGA
jgi:hypothetical protein